MLTAATLRSVELRALVVKQLRTEDTKVDNNGHILVKFPDHLTLTVRRNCITYQVTVLSMP